MNIKELIQKFGGQTELSKKLGIGQSAVAYWAKTERIPAKWYEKLLQIARQENIDIQAIDLAGMGTANDTNPLLPYDGGRDFLFYESDTGTTKVQIFLGDETVWATQAGMAEIFDTSKQNISYHLSNIYKENELDYQSTVKEILTVQKEGSKNVERLIEYHNLDAIIAVGYRVNSYKATQFRKWATSILKEFLIKGFVLDDERLKQGSQMFGKDYFDELLEKIREIRASERIFYQKITDIYSQCSIDYDKKSPTSHKFFAHVQDKFHYAILGHTSAEIIYERADAKKTHMGLTTWKSAKKDGKILKSDVTIGKNYLQEPEISEMNRIVSMFLDSAELWVSRHIPMTMSDWAERLDGFLKFNGYEVLVGFGKVQRASAEKHAQDEYEKFRVKQDKEFCSDFDKMVDELKSKNALPKKEK